jgi:hypothetical protein
MGVGVRANDYRVQTPQRPIFPPAETPHRNSTDHHASASVAEREGERERASVSVAERMRASASIVERERENREKVKKFSVNSPKFAMAMRAFLLIIVIIASLSFIVANFSDVCTISKLLSNPPLSWFGNGDVCSETFVDITCDGSGRVTGIDLKNQGLSGTLTPFISNLTALRSLELQGNKLVGNVSLLTGMDSLTVLSLDDNNFTSPPDDFLHGPTSLTQLSINNLPLEP